MEELVGEPLRGPAGHIFNELLSAVGLRRADVYVGNVLDFRPKRGELKSIAGERVKYDGPFAEWAARSVETGAYLPPETIVKCLERLRADLNECEPNIVVGMGGLAAWALRAIQGHGVIRKIRGTIAPGVLTQHKTLCTYNPGYILPNRSPQERPVMIADFIKARAHADTPDMPESDWPEFVEVTDVRQLPELFARLRPPVACDIETQRHSAIDCIGFSDGALTFSVPFFREKTYEPYWSEADEIEARRATCRFLESPVEKIWQNGGGYDIQVLWELWKVQARGYKHDSRILHRSLWPELGADLASMAATHLNLPAWKPLKGSAEKLET